MLKKQPSRPSCSSWLVIFALSTTSAFAQDPARVVREVGRQERPALITEIMPLLPNGRVDVRREAANAMGQAFAAVPRTGEVPSPPELFTATRALLARTKAEIDPITRGIVLETLGRLPLRDSAMARDVERALRAGLADSDARVVAGAAKGLDAFIRITGKIQPPEAATIEQLRAAAAGAVKTDPDSTKARRLAWLALTAAGPVDIAALERGVSDPDFQIRRRAVLALATLPGGATPKRPLLLRALSDPAFQVRYDAVRVYSRLFQAEDCAPVLAAVDDTSAHVALAAIDALGSGCPAAKSRLMAIADTLKASGAWHRPAHAIVSLAKVGRDEATRRLATFAEHPNWEVRAYAAQAATALGAAARLERLAADANDNVRCAALDGLRTVKGHDADDIYIDALGRSDYQLILLAAQALEGTPHASTAIPALTAALDRLTAEHRDTSRDTRAAIIDRLRELHWTGAVPPLPSPAPVPSPPHPLTPGRRASPLPPSPSPPARARITMADGGIVEIALLVDDAPTVAGRFLQLARQGYYNGLTFHRVVPGFVLQGGSPGANEYSGNAPFVRDELGLRSNERGTIGLSTRGRNTGDMQIFVNLLDNPRLDHDFTVFGEVTSGMDVFDRVLEGDAIARIDVLPPTPAAR